MASMPLSAAILASSWRQDALEHHFHLGDVAEPLDRVPGHRRSLSVGEAGHVDAVEHRLALVVSRRRPPEFVAIRARPRVGFAQSEQGLLVAAAAAVDGDGDSDGACLFGALDMVLGHFPFVRGIELVPDRLAAGGDDVFDRRCRLRRKDHAVIAGLGRQCDRGFAVGVISFVAAGRCHKDRANCISRRRFRATCRPC